MTTGALIFAYNNEVTDYVAMAEWSAKNIRRHLGIPVCLVSDTLPTPGSFEHVISHGVETVITNSRYFVDYGTNVTWHNRTRLDAYSLSPWDRTLVLDADYVVASDQLNVLLEVDEDFLAPSRAFDVVGLNNFLGLNYFGLHRMPMLWATIMMFRKSTKAKLIFNSMEMIRDNWSHYRALYGNNVASYRNDHALTIAVNLVNGHTGEYSPVPWGLASLTPDHTLRQLSQDSYRVDYQSQDGRPKWITLSGQDFHAMGKKHLGEIVANPC